MLLFVITLDLPTGGLILLAAGTIVAIVQRKFQKYDQKIEELTKIQPLFDLMYEAFKNEALDAMRMLAKPNPHPSRMRSLLDKYVATCEGREAITVPEVDELTELLTEAMTDASLKPGQKGWASKALRFIELNSKVPGPRDQKGGH